jgi:hypothetical protein
MLNRIDGYWMAVVAPIEGLIQFTTDPFPPGTDVFASISLNQVNTLFEGNFPDPTFTVTAFIDHWTFYQDDGTESAPQQGSGFNQSSVGINNCARITFIIFAERAWGDAQISIFSF